MDAAPPSLRTVRVVFPHTAHRSVGSREGLNETLVGVTQAVEPTRYKEGNTPAKMAGLTSRVAAVTFQKKTSQTCPEMFVNRPIDAWMAVTKVAEPALQHAVQFGNHTLQGLARFPRRQPDRA